MSNFFSKTRIVFMMVMGAIIDSTSIALAKPLINLPYYRINPSLVAAANSPISQPSITQGNYLLLTDNDIANLKANPRHYASVIASCNEQLNYQPHPVAVLDLQPHYTATGSNENDDKAKNLTQDATMAYRMGFCYLMTNDSRYAITTQRILDAWATTFEIATTKQGSDNINFNMTNMIIAASWVKSAKLPQNQVWNSHKFDTFLINKILPLAQLDNDNNHGLWAVLMKASIGAYLGKEQMLNTAQQRWQQILQGEVAPDGTLPRELARSDTNNYVGGKTKGIKGIAYTHYALLPATMAAKIFSDTGRDVWHTQGGQLLHKAFDRTAILTLHPETSPYYQSNNGQLVGVQNGSYFPLLLKYFPNTNAQQAVKLGYMGGDRFMLPILFE